MAVLPRLYCSSHPLLSDLPGCSALDLLSWLSCQWCYVSVVLSHVLLLLSCTGIVHSPLSIRLTSQTSADWTFLAVLPSFPVLAILSSLSSIYCPSYTILTALSLCMARLSSYGARVPALLFPAICSPALFSTLSCPCCHVPEHSVLSWLSSRGCPVIAVMSLSRCCPGLNLNGSHIVLDSYNLMPECHCRRKVSPTSLLLPLICHVSPASTFWVLASWSATYYSRLCLAMILINSVQSLKTFLKLKRCTLQKFY